jgi:hypothetical protein
MPSTTYKSLNLSSPNFLHAKLHITPLQHIGVNMYDHYTVSCPTHLFCLSNHLRLDNIYNADCQLSIRSHNSNNDNTNKINKHIQDTDSSQATSTLLLLKIQQTKNTIDYLIQAYSSNFDHKRNGYKIKHVFIAAQLRIPFFWDITLC